MAKRAFSDDRDRRKAARGQELKRLATRYLDEIGFIVHKDSRDTIRRIHRDIREHYAARAAQLERTLQQAMASAEQARAAAPGPDAGGRDRDRAAIDEMSSAARRLVADRVMTAATCSPTSASCSTRPSRCSGRARDASPSCASVSTDRCGWPSPAR